MSVHLGDDVRDSITGLSGVVVSRTEWLYGCVRVGVQTRELRDGKPMESVVFDEPQLEILDCGHIAPPQPPQSGGARGAEDARSVRR